jgi:hypothetical protein
MNSQGLISLSAAAVLAFAAGFVITPAFSGHRSSQDGSGTAGNSGDSSSGSSLRSGRALPFAFTNLRPQAEDDLVAGLIDAARDSNDFRRTGRIWWLCEGLTASNAQEVVVAALKGLNGSDRDYVTAALFGGWAKVDAKSALAYAQKLKGEERQMAVFGAVEGWARTDFKAASQWVAQLPPGELKRNADRQLISSLAETDPERALSIALEKSTPETSYIYAYTIFPALVARNPEDAAKRAASLPLGRFRSQALEEVADTWASTDRDAALKWIDSLPDGPSKQQTYTSVLQDWVGSDFEGSLAWLEKQPPGSARNRLLDNLSYSAASDSPENALRLVDLVTSTSGQDEMLQEIARVWSRNSPDAAQQWADSQTDPGVKKAAWRGVIDGISNEAPEQAAALVAKVPESFRGDAASSVASAWSRQDPAAAAVWANTLTTSRAEALGNVMSNWVNDDPKSALSWFSDVPSGKDRDSVVGQFVYTLSRSNPTLAVQWAQTIQDDKARASRLEGVANNWIRTDPASAKAWVANSDLAPDVKTRLLAR